MRLNRGTLIFALALFAIIVVAVVVNNNQQAVTATPTPQPTEATVRLFPELDGNRAVSFEVRNNLNGQNTVLNRDPSFLWDAAVNNPAVVTEGRTVDQVLVPGLLNSFATLTSTQSFQNEDLESYGLAQPNHTLIMTTDDGGVYTVHIGNANLSGNRYFAIMEAVAGSGAPAPTAVPTSMPDAAATPEAAPTLEATPTPEATATPAATSTPRPTGAPSATPTPTATPIVSLSGAQTIYLLPKDVLDTLIGLVNAPPYTPLPTSTPTPFPTPNPFSEVEQTQTAVPQQTATAVSLTATAEALIPPTATATTEPAVSTPAETPVLSTSATATPTAQP